jgi:hypothetical protein
VTSGANVKAADGPRGSWYRFWFQPTDPTTLGFMRIVTGLIVIYVHLAYSFDFQAFFGKHGWYDTASANQERQDTAISVYDWTGAPPKATISTPLVLDQREAVFDFLKHLPENKSQRDEAIEYLYLILDQGQDGKSLSEEDYRQSLVMLARASSLLDEEQTKMLGELRKSEFNDQEMPMRLPVFFIKMKPAERLRAWESALRLLSYFPKPKNNFNAIIGWLSGLTPNERMVLAQFMHELPDGEAGRERIEFIRVWRQDPRYLYARGRTAFSLWFHVTEPTTMWVCHFLFIGIFVLFTVGFCTRVTSVLTWLATLFYIHRTQQVLFGMDTMMNVLLFYLMIGPSGAALSIDRLIARYRAARAIFNAGGKPVPWAEAVLAGPQPSALANFALRCIQIHFCFMYAASGLAKLKGQTWWNTQAAWSTIANPEFCPVQFPIYEKMLLELASIRPLLAVVMAGICYFTLALEIGLPFLIWTRLRPLMITGAVFLHTGIAWMMGLTCFGLLMMTLLVGYLPATTVRERIAWPYGSGPKLTLRYCGKNRRHARLISFVRAMDLTGQITAQEMAPKPGAEDAPAELIAANGTVRTGADLIKCAFEDLVFLRSIAWVLWVPGVALALRWFVDEHAQTLDHVEAVKTGNGTKAPLAR